MSKDMSISEMIAELDRISGLYEQYKSLSGSMDLIVHEKNEEDDTYSLEIVEKIYDFQSIETEKLKTKIPEKKADCLKAISRCPRMPRGILGYPMASLLLGVGSTAFMIFSIIFWISLVIINPGNKALGLIFLSVIMLIASVILWFSKGLRILREWFKWYDAYKKWQEEIKEWEQKFDESATSDDDKRFINECKEYDAAFLNMVDACFKELQRQQQAHESGLESIKDKYLKKAEKLHEEIDGIAVQLDQVTLINKEMLGMAWRISAMLKQGRAETLKEAINLAFDEERKDDEEAKRREEARIQEEILEQQAIDNRMHNEAMERAAEAEASANRAHREAMEQAAEEQARALEKQAEIAKNQARAAERAASARCANCANRFKCTPSARANSGSCGGYRPR